MSEDHHLIEVLDNIGKDLAKNRTALEELANKVVNLAVKIEEVSKKLDGHVVERDAHNPAMMRDK